MPYRREAAELHAEDHEHAHPDGALLQVAPADRADPVQVRPIDREGGDLLVVQPRRAVVARFE
jgi:hypothetical protein